MNRPNDIRGRTERAALLAIVRRCAATNAPLPTHAMLGTVIGISQWQVTRHMNRLMNEGAFAPVQRGKRVFVGEVRA